MILLEFFKIDSLKRDAILNYINDDKIVGHRNEYLVNDITKLIPAESINYKNLFDVFFGISRAKIRYSLDDSLFTDEFSKLLLKNDLSETEEIKRDFLRILNSKLLITSKAINLTLSNDKILLDSKIITDLRPVFNLEKDISSFIGNVITIFLNIDYRINESDINIVYLSLDEDDLSKLKEQIFRAEEKLKILKMKSKRCPMYVK